MSESSKLPRASIIIPVYNGAATLEATLKGVFAQNYPSEDFEVIVVDNNSTDLSVSIAALFPVKIFYAERRNRAFARNTGAKASRGDYLCFLDCDCIPSPNWLSTLIGAFSDMQIGAAQGLITPRGSSAVEYEEFTHNHLGFPFIDTKGCVLSRAAFFAVGPFDESLVRCEDIDLGWRLNHGGWRIIYTNDTSVVCGLPRGIFQTIIRSWESSLGLRQVHLKWKETFNLTFTRICFGFLAVGKRNIARRGEKSALLLRYRALYLLDDMLTGCFYFCRIITTL